MMLFRDRREAGRQLAERLSHYAGHDDVVVLALPRGGIPVAYEVARALGAPLDVFVVRKLGVPGHEELAMGAIASGDVVVLSRDLINAIGVPVEQIERVIDAERRELERRELAYRADAPPHQLDGKTAILIDDGLATGSTMLAAVAALRKLRPRRIVVAVPVAAAETCNALAYEVDEMICAATPEPFRAVGLWYRDFSQTSDDEVRELLQAAHEAPSEARAP
jgi:putative phosphoribosyl transferase